MFHSSSAVTPTCSSIARLGRLVLSRWGKTRHQIQPIVEEDPFVARGLADFRIIEFRVSQRANDTPKRIDR